MRRISQTTQKFSKFQKSKNPKILLTDSVSRVNYKNLSKKLVHHIHLSTIITPVVSESCEKQNAEKTNF